MSRTLAVAHKEVLHLIRDPRSLLAALALPVVLLLLYGFAVDFDLNALPFAAVDHDHSEASRRMIESAASVDSFRYVGELASAREAAALFQRREALVVMVVPPGFEAALEAGETAPVQILVDGSDGSTAAVALGYAVGAVESVGRDLAADVARARGVPAGRLRAPLTARVRVLYNPDLESRQFLVPGLIGVILMLLAALLTSGVVVRERERGSFELLAASPVSAGELLAGKLLPYLGLAVFDVVLAVGMGWGVFGVVPQGSLLLLFGISIFYVFAALALGLLFSCLARTQQIAMLLAFVATVVPTMLLSGFAFPIRNMPWPLQALAQLMPATHYIAIARAIILKGVGLGAWWGHALALVILSLGLMRLAVSRFRKTL